jgi:small-conductance mechanosensitive channel
VVVVNEGPKLPTIDMRSPLTTARSVLWRFLLGMIVLVGVHTLVARARRRLPKLQDDLLMVQLFSVILTLLVTAAAIIQALEHASPAMAGGSLVAIGLAVVFVGARFLPRYIEGLYLMLGPTVRVGDWVGLGDDSGTVAEVGLVRLTLVREDGRRFSIPVASLGGARFSVQPRDHSAPVDVIVPAGRLPEKVRAQMLAAAQMSPYRDPETPVSAVVTGEQLRVHFVAWSPDVVEHAVRHLRATRTRIDERHASV